uniref:hypothetical protein n=1 Tax=Chitinophaga sp. TaxID=1869181 RepID=UPI0031D0519A
AFEIEFGGHVKNDFDCNRSGGSNPSFSAKKSKDLASLQMENLKAFLRLRSNLAVMSKMILTVTGPGGESLFLR